MQFFLKISLLRFAVTAVIILTAFPAMAQRKILQANEISHEEKEVKSLAADGFKVNRLLDISNFYFNVHTPDVQDLNKASAFAIQALGTAKSVDDQTGIGESYLLLSKISQEAKKYLLGKEYAIKAVKTFRKIKKPDLLGESWVMLWSTSTLTGADYAVRIKLLSLAADAFVLSGNKKREGDCFKELGDIYQIQGSYAQSIIVLKRAMKLYVKAGFIELQYIYDLTGRVYLLMGDLDKGIENILLAEKVAEEVGDTSVFSITLNNSIAIAYSQFGELQKALPYIDKALQIAIKFNDIDKISVILVNYVNILNKLGKSQQALTLLITITAKYPVLKNKKNPLLDSMMADIYISRKEFSKASYYCDAIEKKIKNYGTELNKDDIFNFISSVIRYNIAAGHYDKASYYNAKYDSLCNIRQRMFCNAYNLWEFKIDSAAGNYVSAIKHFQRYKQVNDDMFSQAKTTQINQLSILHESEKKDKNIQFLKEQSANQLSRIESANFVRNTTLLGLIIMTMCIFLMYRGYRLNQKANIALNAQKLEINIKNESLQHLVSEKEWLLKEIHHRVKNNLHMVSGLLASQGEYLKGEEAVQAISESQRRVEAMSMIHQRLYQSENLSMINMPSYIYELTENFANSFEMGKKIRFHLDICNVEFPLSHSIPVGLILNEAITNAIKYAFPDKVVGNLEITLKVGQHNNFCLTIKDNGIGLSNNFSIHDCSSLGLKLMKGLTGDMQGNFKIFTNNGTQIELTFTIFEDKESDLKII